MLAWGRRELVVDRHPRSARLARAPDGTWYAVWHDAREGGWLVGHAADGLDFTTAPRTRGGAYKLAGDAELVAELWSVGRGLVARRHDYCNVGHEEDNERGWVADHWECQCGVGGLDFDNVGEAAAAARAHWREALRAELADARDV